MQEKEEKKNEEEQEQENDYIKAIEELKENSVSKDDYEKLKAENKKLIDSLVKGERIEQQQKPREIDVKKIEKTLAARDPRITTLEGMKMVLDLREADIRAGKRDPFISVNNHAPTKEDLEAAQRRADIYQECVDYAEGDPELFSQEFTRRMVDNFSPRKRR